MKSENRRQKAKFCILAFSFWLLAIGFAPIKSVRASLSNKLANQQITVLNPPGSTLAAQNPSFAPIKSVRASLSNKLANQQITVLNPPGSTLAAQNHSCQTQDVKTLTAELLQDLPSYANRVSQRARRLSRSNDVYSYMLVAGRPEFAPLTLGPGVYAPASPPAQSQSVQQVFFTTLERRYTDGKPIELQDFHWLFLTKTKSGWRLATMFTQTGGYPAKKPPTPPRESSDGVIGQAIETWLRDCQAETKRNDEL